MNFVKKSLLVVIPLILMFGISANRARAQAGFGIRGGVNFSTLSNTDVHSHTGLMLGLYFDAPLADNWVILQPEVLYTQKGFETNGLTHRIDYLEIPVLFRVNIINPSGILPFIYAGPYVGFKINTSFPETSASTPAGEIDFNNGDNVNNTDFGITVGGGLDFGHLSLGVRYDAGLTDVFETTDAKNGVLSIVAGIGY